MASASQPRELVAGSVAWRRAWGWPRREAIWRDARIEVDAESLRLVGSEATRVVPRKDVSNVVVTPRGVSLEIRKRWGMATSLDVEVPPATADALLDALGIGPAHRVWRTDARSVPFFWIFMPMIVFQFMALGATLGVAAAWFLPQAGQIAGAAVGAALGVLYGIRWAHKWWPEEIVLGSDGIRIQKLLKTRMLRYDDVTSVEVENNFWRFSLREESLVLPTDWEPTKQAMVSRWIQTALAEQRVHYRRALAREFLDRSGRDTADWVTALRALLTVNSGGYRTVPVDRGALGDLLAHGGEAPHQRVAAAVALSATGDAAERARVRVAADTAAEPELGEALRALADGEFEEAGHALDKFEVRRTVK